MTQENQMPSDHQNVRSEELIQRLLDHTLSAVEEAELAELLKSSPALAERLAGLMRLEGGIAYLGKIKALGLSGVGEGIARGSGPITHQSKGRWASIVLQRK